MSRSGEKNERKLILVIQCGPSEIVSLGSKTRNLARGLCILSASSDIILAIRCFE